MAAGWSPTVDNYLGRVTKARIVQAVREARGETAAQLIEHLKKGEMAERPQELLAGSGWIPEPLRTPGRATAQRLRCLNSARRSAGARLERNRRRPDTKRPWPIQKGRPKMYAFSTEQQLVAAE